MTGIEYITNLHPPTCARDKRHQFPGLVHDRQLASLRLTHEFIGFGQGHTLGGYSRQYRSGGQSYEMRCDGADEWADHCGCMR